MSNKVKQSVVDSVFDSLVSESSHRVIKSLGIIRKACENELEKGRLNFTIASIGRLSESMGGPKEQAIRNKTNSGKVYRSLIKAYATTYQPKKEERVGILESYEDVLAGVEDHKIRIRMLDFLAKNKKLENQIKQQQMALNAPDWSDLQGNPISHSAIGIDLNLIELKALSHFISQDNINSRNWSVSNDGQIIDESGKALTKRGFVDAIEKLNVVSEQSLIGKNDG
ncbi:gamma-mobile-trio protein GmtX [Pseudoalteromonas maricaloris]|uniref:gamma-mobile-trio protein GmtX n=1 Tax=Pseudoalteromonas maricaloris TaxID=184924 RepID=UPI003C147C30